MNDKLKELIKKASCKPVGYFTSLMFISNGKYDGFWKENGYDNILILGYSDGEWYRVSEYGDVFNIYRTLMNFNLDIPTEYGVPRIWFDEPIYIDNSLELSSVVGKFKEGAE